MLAKRIGISIAEEKSVGPAKVLTFLGFELSTKEMLSRIPEDKMVKYRSEIHRVHDSNKCTLKEFQVIIG